MRTWFGTMILIFAVLASGVHASPESHDHDANAVHFNDLADDDYHLVEVAEDSHDSAPADMTGDVITHFHVSVGLAATAPSVLNAAAHDRQPNLQAPGKVLASLSSRPLIQPPSA
jgi:hypothetical protein